MILFIFRWTLIETKKKTCLSRCKISFELSLSTIYYLSAYAVLNVESNEAFFSLFFKTLVSNLLEIYRNINKQSHYRISILLYKIFYKSC